MPVEFEELKTKIIISERKDSMTPLKIKDRDGDVLELINGNESVQRYVGKGAVYMCVGRDDGGYYGIYLDCEDQKLLHNYLADNLGLNNGDDEGYTEIELSDSDLRLSKSLGEVASLTIDVENGKYHVRYK